MSAEEFCASVESGEVLVDCHDRLLRIAFIYSDEGLWDGNGVLDIVDKLHARGWSFGQGDLKFNRTLDIFYLAQIAAGIYRSEVQFDEQVTPDDFEKFYAQHQQLLNQDAWRQYYSPAFLAQATSSRFYRLPDLQDLPDSGAEVGDPRKKGIGQFTKLPRWAYNASRTAGRSPTLSVETVTQLAVSTLQQNILRLRRDHPSVQPYSATQASFWLKYMNMDSYNPTPKKHMWRPNNFDIYTAQAGFDMWAWEAHYSRELWESEEARVRPLEPDLDGTRESEVRWCGMPEGAYVEVAAKQRGWDPEVGSEEEIELLAEVAVNEMESIEASNWDYEIRSHMLLGVVRAAFEADREKYMEDLKRSIAEAGNIDESKVERWIQEVQKVVEPYVQKWDVWPAAVEDRGELLRQILVENGQLFAGWRLSPTSKEFDFMLKPKE
ncbi:hypothetical protein V492_05466 [Pseudogymnoascus sp. VKM F-4246]|nr:hypothetical protein V492_05466 [Pseudogymnoascus sp. VKM F-4246]